MKFVDINSLSQFLKNLKNIFEPKGSLDAAKVYTDDSLANLTADDIGVYVQAEEPTDAVEGDIWVDVDAESHLDPEIVIDATLTQSGQAADAKVVGDAVGGIVIVSANLCPLATASTIATGYMNTSCGCYGRVEAGKTYTFAVDAYKPAIGTSNIGIRNYTTDIGGTRQEEYILYYGHIEAGKTERISTTFTANYDGYLFLNANFTKQGANSDGAEFMGVQLLSNIQLEEGDTATEYMEYGSKTVYSTLKDRVEQLEEDFGDYLNRIKFNSHIKSIAHQGGSGFGCPQNTKENIIACAKNGWKYAEFDIRWTADNVPVLSHDDIRTIYGGTEAITISASTYDELLNVRLFNDEDIKISTFYEAIDACKMYGLIACIEIKASFDDVKLDDLFNYLKHRNMECNCMWLSFQLGQLVSIVSKDNEAVVNLCLSEAKDLEWAQNETRFDTVLREDKTILNFAHSILSGVDNLDNYFNGFKDMGFRIGVYTIDDKDLIGSYLPYVDYMTSNLYKVEDAII